MRILVVDDDPVQRQLAALALRLGGHEIVGVGDGAEALALLAKSRFDVALVDHEMPGMTGFAVLMALGERGLLADMPVVYVTSRDDLAVIDRAFELGASGFVAKPVNWALMQHQLRFVVRAAENERTAAAARDEALRLARAKDQLLAITRHELRTPLNAVIGFGRILRDGLKGNDEMGRAAEEMLSGAERLNARIADMMICLDLANGRVATSPNSEDVAALIEDNLPVWRRQAAASGVRLTCEVEAPGLSILVDAAHLVSIVGRLVDNALLHGASTTQVTISVRLAAEGRVAIAIMDDGRGVTPDMLERCRIAFSQADMSTTRFGEGLGLGLHIVQGLAALNGMTVELGPASPAGGAIAVLTAPRHGAGLGGYAPRAAA
jgi:signal transduction histidine kinase